MCSCTWGKQKTRETITNDFEKGIKVDKLVSVIVPVYNVEQYLDKCIESIINQTYKTIEIILVDDGSLDTCPQKCDYWATLDKRIKVIHKNNEGVGFARNAGIDVASGEYIVFLDSDDYILSNAIEIMLNRIERDQSDLVAAQKVKVFSDGSQKSAGYTWMQDMIITKDEAMHMLGSTDNPFPVHTGAKLYRRFIFNKIRFTNLKSGEDTYILPHIIDCCKTISITNTTVYHYYQRDSSIVHTMTQDMQLDNIKAVLHVARFLLDHNYIEEARVYYNSAICRSIKMKHDDESNKIIKTEFDSKERKIMGKSSFKMKVSKLAYRFPIVYNYYKTFRKRNTII